MASDETNKRFTIWINDLEFKASDVRFETDQSNTQPTQFKIEPDVFCITPSSCYEDSIKREVLRGVTDRALLEMTRPSARGVVIAVIPDWWTEPIRMVVMARKEDDGPLCLRRLRNVVGEKVDKAPHSLSPFGEVQLSVACITDLGVKPGDGLFCFKNTRTGKWELYTESMIDAEHAEYEEETNEDDKD